MRGVVQYLGKVVTLQASDRKVVALNVFTNIVQLNVGAINVFHKKLFSISYLLISVKFIKFSFSFQIISQTPELLTITKKWFSQLSENPVKTIISVCEKPFYELKLAGLASLNAIAEQPWGQEEIFKCPGTCL